MQQKLKNKTYGELLRLRENLTKEIGKRDELAKQLKYFVKGDIKV